MTPALSIPPWIILPSDLCPLCGKIKRAASSALDKAKRLQQSMSALFAGRRVGARGDRMVDASGAQLDGETACCCGSGSAGVPAACGPGCSPPSLKMQVTLDGFNDLTGECWNILVGGSQNSMSFSGSLNGSTFVLDYTNALNYPSLGSCCGWQFSGSGPVAVNYYSNWLCGYYGPLISTSNQIQLYLALCPGGGAWLGVIIGDYRAATGAMGFFGGGSNVTGTGTCTDISLTGSGAGGCSATFTEPTTGIMYCGNFYINLVGDATATAI